MTSPASYVPQGVIPAVLMPFQTDFEIDQDAYKQHVRDLANTEGVTALVINGHAAEVHTMSFDEQQLALDLTLDTVGNKTPVICGIYSESTLHAQKLARMAAAAGARCLLAFPPNVLMFNGAARPQLFVDYYKALADATDLPIILFQFPKWTNLQVPFDTLIKVCESNPHIVAIKDMCGDPALHEKQIRTLHGLARPVNVMTTHSSWLMGSLPMGVRGIISGAGSVIANLQVALFDAFQQNDLARAKVVGDRIYAAVQAFYEAPYIDWQARMKETLVALGRLPNAVVRPPLQSSNDPKRLAYWLDRAGLTRETLYARVD